MNYLMFLIMTGYIVLPNVVLFTLFYFKARNKLWLLPVTVFIFDLLLTLRDILKFNYVLTFSDKMDMYFKNDSSMTFYMIYMPMFIFSIILLVVYYVIQKSKLVKKNL